MSSKTCRCRRSLQRMASRKKKLTYKTKILKITGDSSPGSRNPLRTYGRTTRTSLIPCLCPLQPCLCLLLCRPLRYFNETFGTPGKFLSPTRQSLIPKLISSERDAYGVQASPTMARLMESSTTPTNVVSTAPCDDLTFIWQKSSKPERWEEADESHVRKRLP